MNAMDISTFDLTSIVTIVLQTTGTEIMIHKQVLCTHCAFAEVCLQGGFKQVEPDKILLQKEEEEDSIRTLIAWMYHGKAILPTIPGGNDYKAKDALPSLALGVTKLYITASKYLMTNFKKEIMLFWTKLCQTKASSMFLLPSLELLLQNSPPVCELKQLLIDRLIQNVRTEGARGLRSFFIEYPDKPFSKAFFTLTCNHPELANTILQRLLQPEVQTEPDIRLRLKKRQHDDEESLDPMLQETNVRIKRRRPS